MAWVVPAIAAVGEAAGTAAGAVGSTIGSAASALGSLFGGEAAAGAAGAEAGAAAPAAAALVPEAAGAAVPAAAAPAAGAAPGLAGTLINAAQTAIPTTGLGTLAEGLQSLFAGPGEAAPGFVGPPASLAGPAVTGPGFAGGFVQGLLGQYAPAAAPSGASSAGGGLGQLVSFLNQMHGGGGQAAPMGPIVRMGGMPTKPFTTLIPQSQQTEVETGPIMKLLAHL